MIPEGYAVASQIYEAIKALGKEAERSQGLIEEKARALADYDKSVGVAVTTLKADGQSVSVIKDIVKGKVSDKLHIKILAEETLKAHYSKIDRLKAQLNGLQSVNRYLDSMPENK